MNLALEIDSTFIQGMAAFVSAIIVFVGSVALLLALVLGARLAYFISATITLSFVLIMSIVWSFGWNTTPLGPVGQLPKWSAIAVGETVDDVDFGPASSYPDEGNWHAVDKDDVAESTKASELESAAGDELELAINEDKVKSFLTVSQASVNQDLTRLLEEGSDEYGGVTFEAAEGTAAEEGAQAVIFMSYDPGNPYGDARKIAGGTFILWVLHLFGLSRSERRVRRRAETASATTTTTRET